MQISLDTFTGSLIQIYISKGNEAAVSLWLSWVTAVSGWDCRACAARGLAPAGQAEVCFPAKALAALITSTKIVSLATHFQAQAEVVYTHFMYYVMQGVLLTCMSNWGMWSIICRMRHCPAAHACPFIMH